MKKHTTIIDHKIRVKLKLSLQDYTLLYFLSEWFKTNKNKPTNEDFINLIGCKLEDATTQLFLTKLQQKNFINKDYVPTALWKNEFKVVREKVKFVPPSLEAVILYFKSNGYNTDGAKQAFNYYNSADWKDSKGNPVINWKQKMIGNWFRDEFKKESVSEGVSSNIQLGKKS